MTATLRYELRMQLRRPAMWAVTAVTLVLLWLLIGPELPMLLREPARIAMIRTIIFCDVPLPIGFAFLIADRLVRDGRTGVAAILDATPTAGWRRLIGKYLGCVTATGLPIVAVYFGIAVAYAARNSAPQALLWTLAMFGAITLPALLFVGALALSVPLAAPPAVFRVLFVGYWIWTSYLVPPRLVPTLSQTVVDPVGGYPIQVFFGYHGGHAGSGGPSDWAGPVPGAVFNVVRPTPNQATAWLSIGILLGLSVLCLSFAQLARERRAQ
ncbi:MAG TPA: hypothetical protein VGJ07_09705 [Rugosimonospora sp.]